MALLWSDIRDRLKTHLARLVRKTILATATASGYDQVEGYEPAADEPRYGFGARRMQSYGFTSYVPEGAEVVVLAVGGGSNNRVYVASELPGAAPTLEKGEVSIYSKFGQRLLLDKNSRVSVDNGDDGTLVVVGDKTTISQDLAVSRDLTVSRDGRINRDLVVNHLIGDGDITHGAIPNAPVIASADAVGDDVSFDLTFSVAAMQTLASGAVVATVGLARSYGSEPRCVASPKSGSFPGPASFGAAAAAPGVIEVRYYGQPISGAVTGLSCTVFIVGKS